MVEPALNRRNLLAAAVLLAGTGPARADGSRLDYEGRMTLAVSVNGSGPLRFVLDSAASLSLIASDLVEPLGLAPAGVIGMHTLLAREQATTVIADRVVSGPLDERGVRMALGLRSALGGHDGLISPMLLSRRRVTLNFRSQRISVGRTRARGESEFSPVRRIRFTSPESPAFGSLVVIPASVAGRRVAAILDTGAASTIANMALADATGLRMETLADGSRTQAVLSATGRSAPARMAVLPAINLGPVSFDRVPVLTGDFHAFQVWGFEHTPALLLGTDVLGGLRQLVIDYGTRSVTLDV